MPDLATDTAVAPSREAPRPDQRSYTYTSEGGKYFVIQPSEVGGGLVYEAAEYEAQLAATQEDAAVQG